MLFVDVYVYVGDVMVCNMMEEDVGEGIDVFLEKCFVCWCL